MPDPLLIAKDIKGEHDLCLLPGLANRHGLIAGATGTGKTVTLQRMAESLSRIGVPVFMADVKGDLAGLSQAGELKGKIKDRVEQLKLADFKNEACPVVFWDTFGKQGHPVRTTASEMGPLLLARMLNLNDTQQGVLTMAFKIADDNGLLLLDMKDLRAMLQYVGDNAKEFTTQYGNVSAASIGAIQRGLLELDQQGADQFFGEPALNIEDFIQTDSKGRGVINILAADKLMTSPKLYATFLLWMLSELFENLPEVGRRGKTQAGVFLRRSAPAVYRCTQGACWKKSSRWCGWCGPRAWVFTSSRRTRWMCLIPCSASLATVCSMLCAPSPRAISKRSNPPRRPCEPTPTSTLKKPSPNSAWVKRWCRSSMPRARPPSSNARL